MSVANGVGRPLPQITTLLAFEAAGRLGSFSEAAGELGLTQSAVSQQMRKLEQLTGQRLFLRRGTVVRLTGAGEQLFKTVGTTLAGLAADEHLAAGRAVQRDVADDDVLQRG